MEPQHQQTTAWEHLMSAAEGVASRFQYAGPSPDRVEGDILELRHRCPGFEEHEYRQAYWQGVQNLKHRTESVFATDGDGLLIVRADHAAFDAAL